MSDNVVLTGPTNKNFLLKAEGVSMNFGSVKVLEKVDFEVYPNEVVGLVGDNGAGKSTLMKIIVGIYTPSEGQILLEGKITNFASPRDSRNIGVEMIYQELEVVDCLEIWENIFLGKLIRKSFLGGLIKIIDRKTMQKESVRQLKALGINIDSSRKLVANLSGGERKAVAISRAVYWQAKIAIMDEPTAALGVSEVAKVLQLIKSLKEKGISVVFISHNLQEVFFVADRIVVLTKGRIAGVKRREKTTPDKIIKLMVEW